MKNEKSTQNILRDEVLDSRIIDDIKNCPNGKYECNDLLITGVTGFLGAHTLAELLETTQNRHIYCLIRGEDLDRVRKTLIDYKLWKDEFVSRFTVISGNLAKENLGLVSSAYNELVLNISQILHIAADTNHVKAYHHLRGSNVNGTIELIKLASKERRKEIIYTSTLSVLNEQRENDEDAELQNPELIHEGYIQTKYVSEKLLLQAKEAGLKVDIIRVGRVASSTATGMWCKTDGYYMVFKSFYKLNMVPDIRNRPLLFMPVDYMSICISKVISTDISPNGCILHLHNSMVPFSFKDFYKALQRIKPDCRWVTHEEWFDALLNVDDPELKMCRYIAELYFPVRLEDNKQLENHEDAKLIMPISTEKTMAIFKKHGIPILTEFKADYIEKIFACIEQENEKLDQL